MKRTTYTADEIKAAAERMMSLDDENKREAFEERAAIIEYDALTTREVAERIAFEVISALFSKR